MAKDTKQLLKQARIAERSARETSDPEASESLARMAVAYRVQAEIMKKNRKTEKSAEKSDKR